MLILIIIIAGIVLLYLLFWPVPIRPIKWTPPKAPKLEGVFQSNYVLATAEFLAVGGHGPEDVIFDSQGRLYTGLENGEIKRMQNDGSGLETFAVTGGRPLGLAFDAEDNLLIADADKGLLSANPQGDITVLVERFEGRSLKFSNHLDVAADGTIYFTETSDRFPFSNVMAEIIESRPNGRLFAFAPESGDIRQLLAGLYFANGVAISPDQSFLLFCETTRYRIQRLWLRGPEVGKTEIFIDNLPGFPDNLHGDGQGNFWVSMVLTRMAVVDRTAERPFIRKIIFRLPDAIKPKPVRHGFVLGLDSEGRIRHNLQDASGKCANTTGATEYDGMLYVGNLYYGHIARLSL